MAVSYGFGFLGNKSPAKETNTATVHSQQVAPGSSGRVTMIDVGATECIPCKMMAPIMKELEEEYAGIADIIFIDVWKNPAEGRKYGVQTIPTQIFFDRSGKEVFRHVGFMDKKPIVETLTRLGAIRPASGLTAGSPNKEG
ncbi:MAG TPA: thiol reductase thioredoxin [Desulfobulbaceae bacterium]|nr:thiol reductase thioredoxin [Desulfobulbaceae bacterium]